MKPEETKAKDRKIGICPPPAIHNSLKREQAAIKDRTGIDVPLTQIIYKRLKDNEK